MKHGRCGTANTDHLDKYISFTIYDLSPEYVERVDQNIRITKKDPVCITTDNSANMLKALEEFPDVLLGWFGHNLNLAISKKFRELTQQLRLTEREEKRRTERKPSCPQHASED